MRIVIYTTNGWRLSGEYLGWDVEKRDHLILEDSTKTWVGAGAAIDIGCDDPSDWWRHRSTLHVSWVSWIGQQREWADVEKERMQRVWGRKQGEAEQREKLGGLFASPPEKSSRQRHERQGREDTA